MKKLIFPAVLAVVSLVFFSFKPMDKTINGTVIKNMTASVAKQCNEWDTNHPNNFVSCYKISTDVPPAENLSTALTKY